jgi:hypothetical protein
MAAIINPRGSVRINLGSVVFWPVLFLLSFAVAAGAGIYVVWATVEQEGSSGPGFVALVVGGLVAFGSWKIWRGGTPHLLIDVPAGMIHFRGYKPGSCRLAELDPQIEAYKDVARVTTTMYRVLGRGLDNAVLKRTPYEDIAKRFLAQLNDYRDDAAIREILAATGLSEGAFRDPDAQRRMRECVPDEARRKQALTRLAQDRDSEIRARALAA